MLSQAELLINIKLYASIRSPYDMKTLSLSIFSKEKVSITYPQDQNYELRVTRAYLSIDHASQLAEQ